MPEGRAAAEAAQSRLNALVCSSKTPGIQYLVVSPERTVFEYVGGWADVAGQRPLTPSTTLMAYSMSKTITAAAVLRLVETKKAALDDPIDHHLGSPGPDPRITIRHLLSHTSGIPNPIPLTWVHPVTRHEAFDERAALATVLRRYPKPTSAPGTTYKYSNIGYWLLGPIVEQASGDAFTSYVVENVLKPLGITPSELGYTIPDHRAHAGGYLEKYSLINLFKGFLVARDLIGDYQGRWLGINGHYVNGPAFGGLVGTARGFGRFLQDQLQPHSRLLNDKSRELFYTPERVSRGTVIPMTLGWHVGTMQNARFFYKEGGGGGFRCMMRVYPGFGIATVVMANATGVDVGGLLDEADARFLHPAQRRPPAV